MRISKAGNSNKGFTLLEIIMVLFILALTTGLVLPDVGRLFQGDVLKTSVNRLVSAVAQTRSQAMLDGEPWVLVIDTSGDQEPQKSMSIDRTRKAIFVRAEEGARFRDVALIRTGDVLTEEQVPLVFQPDGLAEPALVHCESADGVVTTVYLKAFNPRPMIIDGDRSLDSLSGEGR